MNAPGRRPARCGALALLWLLPWVSCCSGAAAAADGAAHPELWPSGHGSGITDPASEARISQLMAHMSLAEQVGQVIQADIDSIHPADLVRYPLGSILVGGDPAPRGGAAHASLASWRALTRAFQRRAAARRDAQVRIPLLLAIDAAHGVAHVRGATIFPQAIGLGAAHDPALIEQIGAATAEEASALGFNWVFTPTLAIPQDLRWGRTFEAWSADPALVRRYADAMVRGVQGLPAARVAATAKHFIGDGATTDGIDQGDAAISEQALIDVHAQGYLAAIDAGVLTVMASYSSWQGSKLHADRGLLRDVLKQRLGFEGLVIGDWNGHNQVEGCTSGDCPQAFNAGLDMFMAPDGWRELFDHLLAQVRSGEIPGARLEDAVRRILRVKLKLGLLDEAPRPSIHLAVIGAAAHRALARRAVQKSLVLLKNSGAVLPIRSGARVLIAGEAANDIGQQCGGWTLSWQGAAHHNQDFPRAQSVLDGIAATLAAGGGSVEWSPDGRYRHRPDVAVVVFGELPYAEGLGDRASLDFEQPALLELLRRLHADAIPIVSVFLSGRPLQVDAELDVSDAFVAAWLPGSEGGGIADVLLGDGAGAVRHDFNGTLPFAWPSRFTLGYGLHYADAPMRN